MDVNSLVISLLILIVIYLLLTRDVNKVEKPAPQPVQIVYEWPRRHYFGPYRRRFLHRRRI